jgi:hypothetical protein
MSRSPPPGAVFKIHSTQSTSRVGFQHDATVTNVFRPRQCPASNGLFPRLKIAGPWWFPVLSEIYTGELWRIVTQQQRMVLRGASAVDKACGDFRICRRRDNGFIRPMADSYRKRSRMIPRPFPRIPAINRRHGMVANPFALTNLNIADFAAIFPSCSRMNQ